MLRLSRLIPKAAALALALLGGSSLMAQSADSARITELLQQAKDRALQANRDAESIDSYVRSKTTWVSHASSLSSMKDHINSMGQTLAEMNSAQAEGSPWQQQAISEIHPVLQSMADHLTAMINHLNEHPTKVHMPAYVAYAKANLDLSGRMLSVIRDYVDYAQARATADELENKLELPAEGAGSL